MRRNLFQRGDRGAKAEQKKREFSAFTAGSALNSGHLVSHSSALRSRAPAQQSTLAADLSSLPILKLWPGDGGRFVTFPLVLTEDPETRRRNLGIYRMHVFDGASTGMHWQIGKGEIGRAHV